MEETTVVTPFKMQCKRSQGFPLEEYKMPSAPTLIPENYSLRLQFGVIPEPVLKIAPKNLLKRSELF